MKAIVTVIAFLIGIVVAAAACSVIGSARHAARQVQVRSDVHDPVRLCLDDIVATYERGDPALAERKARLLQQRWSEYLKGGPTPELFAGEIVELRGEWRTAVK